MPDITCSLTHEAHLRAGAQSFGQRLALRDAYGRSLTYTDLYQCVTMTAERLRSEGIRKGDIIAWLDWNSLEYLIMYFGTALVGARIAPINRWLRNSEIEARLRHISPRVLFVDRETPSIGDVLEHTRVKALRLGDDLHIWTGALELSPPDSSRDDVFGEEDSLHEIIFTSGSTGHIKAVTRTQRSRLLDSYRGALLFGLGSEDDLLWFLPQFHVGGGGGPNQVLLQGGTSTVLRKFGAGEVVALIRENITHLVGVPTHYERILQEPTFSEVDTSQVRGIFVGGAAVPSGLFTRLARAFPRAELMHGYGSTESGGHTLGLRGKQLLERPGSVGIPAAGTEVRIGPIRGESSDDGEGLGEILVRSEANMSGYFGEPELSGQVVDEYGWLHTGDLGYQDSDGYFYIAGRGDGVIISGGENVFPEEVEDALCQHPSIHEAAVVGVPDDVYGEKVVAYIVAETPEGPAPSVDQLSKYMASMLAGFKTPREYIFLEDLPRTSTGKVQKFLLGSGTDSVSQTSTDGQAAHSQEAQ